MTEKKDDLTEKKTDATTTKKDDPMQAARGCLVLIVGCVLLLGFCEMVQKSPSQIAADNAADHDAAYHAAVHRLAREWDAEHGDPTAIHEYTTKLCADHPDICTNDK